MPEGFCFSAPSAAHDQGTAHQLTASSLSGPDDLAHKASFICQRELAADSYTKHTSQFSERLQFLLLLLKE